MYIYAPVWMRNMPDVLDKLSKGESVSIGNNVYSLCCKCNHVIKVNKFMLGSLHFCSLE